MWEPRRLTTIWALTACYRDSFTLAFIIQVYWEASNLSIRIKKPPYYKSLGIAGLEHKILFSLDSAVGIATGYGLDVKGVRV
jgi:hypothetical protein